MSRRFRWQREVGALDMVSNVTANLLESVKEAQWEDHVQINSNDVHSSRVWYRKLVSELELVPTI